MKHLLSHYGFTSRRMCGDKNRLVVLDAQNCLFLKWIKYKFIFFGGLALLMLQRYILLIRRKSNLVHTGLHSFYSMHFYTTCHFFYTEETMLNIVILYLFSIAQLQNKYRYAYRCNQLLRFVNIQNIIFIILTMIFFNILNNQ